jgi:polysaccharide pyruvyl transferase WcaK-like protein
LETIVPEIRLLDRRDMSIEESVWWIAGAKHVCAARLHVLLVAQYFKVDFSPFVYQEKIEKCVLRAEQTILASH